MTILGEILGIFIPNSEFRIPNFLSFPQVAFLPWSCVQIRQFHWA